MNQKHEKSVAKLPQVSKCQKKNLSSGLKEDQTVRKVKNRSH